MVGPFIQGVTAVGFDLNFGGGGLFRGSVVEGLYQVRVTRRSTVCWACLPKGGVLALALKEVLDSGKGVSEDHSRSGWWTGSGGHGHHNHFCVSGAGVTCEAS